MKMKTHALRRTCEGVLVSEVAARCLVRLLLEQVGNWVLGAVAVHDLLRGISVRARDERPSGVSEVAAFGQLLDRLAHLVVSGLVHQCVPIVRRQITAKNEYTLCKRMLYNLNRIEYNVIMAGFLTHALCNGTLFRLTFLYVRLRHSADVREIPLIPVFFFISKW